MPTVKTYQRQVSPTAAPTVQRGEYRIAQLETPAARPTPSPEALGAGFGKAVGSAAGQLFTEQQHKDDSIRLLDADKQTGDLENALLYDQKTGALNVKGKNAFGLVDSVGKSWDDGVGKIRQGLANDRQRMAYDQHTANVRQRIMGDLDRHIATETYRVDGEALEGKTENETQAAIEAGGTGQIERVSQSIESVQQAYADYGKRWGIPAEQTKAATDKAVSRIHQSVLGRMLDNGNDIQAKVYYEHAQGEILPSERGRIEASLKKETTVGDAQRASDSIIGGQIFGMVKKGNLDPFNRPILNNETGEVLPPGSDVSRLKDYSTMSTITIEDDKGVTILIPTVVDGKRLTEKEAIAHYQKTGEHFGQFASEDAAERYDGIMHARMRRQAETGDGSATLQELLDETRLQTQDKPEVREKAEARVKTWFSEVQTDARVKKEEAAQVAKRKLDDFEKNTKNTMDRANKRSSFEQVIPQSVRDTMSEPVEKAMREYWKMITEEKEPKTDPGTFYTLYSLGTADATKDKFAQTDLMRYVSQLSRGDFSKLVELQGAIRKGDEKKADGLTEGYRTVNEMVQDAMRIRGLDPTPKDGTDESKRIGALHQAIDQDMADFEERHKKKPTKPEIQQMIDDHLIQGTVTTKGILWDSKEQKYVIDVPADQPVSININQVPKDEVAKIEQALSRAGVPESEALIIQLYLKKIRKTK